ncbi:hypothetical protein [Aeromicrobium sp. UC242_57]|uniref:hypothetical protein n=1 Tax=Aeromicrobium sp. UC242_57 TaxID=3374624 RepID=UPI00379B0604
MTTRSAISMEARPVSASRTSAHRTSWPKAAKDVAVREADSLLLTVPNQLGVAYNTRLLSALAEHVLPAIGWKPRV